MVTTHGVKLGAKAARLLARLRGTGIRSGLTEQELTGIEARFGFAFADDHRAFLAVGLPTGGDGPTGATAERPSSVPGSTGRSRT